MKINLLIGLLAVLIGFVAVNAYADENVAPASQAVPADPCNECEPMFGGFGVV